MRAGRRGSCDVLRVPPSGRPRRRLARVLRVFYESTKLDPVGIIMSIAEFIQNPLTLEQAGAILTDNIP